MNTTDCRFEYWLVKIVLGRFAAELNLRVLSRGVQTDIFFNLLEKTDFLFTKFYGV